MSKLACLVAVLAALPAAAQAGSARTSWADTITPFGYAKAGYFFVTPSGDDGLVGARNGFRLINLRVGASLQPVEKLEVVASIDGAVARRNETDPLSGNRVVELRDAFVEWTPSRFAALRVGQFKAPFNQESLLPDGQLPFITRSVISDGAVPPEAFPLEGLSLDRQVGIQLASERLGSDSAGFRYAVALVNGNGPNVLNNDSGGVAPVLRLAYEYKDLVTIGLNGYYNQRVEGVRPNRIQSDRLAYGGDLGLALGGLDALAVVILRNTSHPNTGLPSEGALGLLAHVRYLHSSGIEGGLRFANYEPSNLVPDDKLIELAAMIGYRLKSVPLRVLAQYTMRVEEAPVSIGNDSIDALAQVNW